MDYDNDFIDSEDSVDFNFDSDLESTSNVKDDSPKKRILVLGLLIGFLLMGVSYSAISFINNNGNRNSNKEVNTSIETKQNENSLNNSLNSSSGVSNHTSNEWIAFSLGNYGSLGGDVESIFTIAEIESLYAKSDASSNPMIKIILKGNISGLLGIFEFEVGYDIGRKASIGQQVDVLYNTIRLDDTQVICNIRLAK